MITVHHLDQSRSQRILWLLEELGLPYDIQRYRRDPNTRLAPPELMAIHPLGKSPVITDEGRVVAESGAIVDYIIRRHGEGRLQPAVNSDSYEDYVYWLHYAEGSAVLPLLLKSNIAPLRESGAALMPRIEGQLSNHLGFIDSQLRGRDYLLGDELTGADIQLSFVGELAGARTDRSAYPHLDAWVRRYQARSAYKSAIDRGGPYMFFT